MQNAVRKSEHYREKAAKYHELGKRAHPPYLGEFYRGRLARAVADGGHAVSSFTELAALSCI